MPMSSHSLAIPISSKKSPRVADISLQKPMAAVMTVWWLGISVVPTTFSLQNLSSFSASMTKRFFGFLLSFNVRPQ
jgi:hypothetical protein